MKRIIGTGGIGTGIFYRLEDNRDIGREETRLAHRLDQKDYCKQHIILHYLAVLLRDLQKPVGVFPIGAVGEDAMGSELLREMRDAGMRIDHVKRLPDAATLSAICYLFPNGDGGNLTESRSACARISPRDIERAWRRIRPGHGESLILAAPEVPLASRVRLLQLGRKHGAFNVASFIAQEVPEFKKRGWFRLVDLLAVNLNEAAALAGVREDQPPKKIAMACGRAARKDNPGLRIVVTAGSRGAFGLERDRSLFLPVLKVKARNTAGAGDAFLSGVMLGTILGHPFISDDGKCALRLGRAIAAMKVLAPHTINFDIRLKSLRAFLRAHGESGLLQAD
jgi:sugar/nucleoside kinase (ribokinase family)